MTKKKDVFSRVLESVVGPSSAPVPSPEGALASSVQDALDTAAQAKSDAMRANDLIVAVKDRLDGHVKLANVMTATALTIFGIAAGSLIPLYNCSVGANTKAVESLSASRAAHKESHKSIPALGDLNSLRAQLARAHESLAVLEERLKSTAACRCEAPEPADMP